MTLDALQTRTAVAIAAVALLATLAGSLFWFSRWRHQTADRMPCRIAIVAPRAESLTIIVPDSVDPRMPILVPAGPIDSIAVAAPATGDLGIVARRAVIDVATPRTLWTTLVAAGAPLWFANLADDALSGLLGQAAAPTT
jgi:hypothetical protein